MNRWMDKLRTGQTDRWIDEMRGKINNLIKGLIKLTVRDRRGTLSIKT